MYYIYIPNEVVAKLTNTELAVLNRLMVLSAQYANKETKSFYRSKSLMEKEFRMSGKTLNRTLKSLQDMGYITVCDRINGKTCYPPLFKVNFDVINKGCKMDGMEDFAVGNDVDGNSGSNAHIEKKQYAKFSKKSTSFAGEKAVSGQGTKSGGSVKCHQGGGGKCHQGGGDKILGGVVENVTTKPYIRNLKPYHEKNLKKTIKKRAQNALPKFVSDETVERRNTLKEQVYKYFNYSLKVLDSFFVYWSRITKNGNLFIDEKCGKIWDIDIRLRNWNYYFHSKMSGQDKAEECLELLTNPQTIHEETMEEMKLRLGIC